MLEEREWWRRSKWNLFICKEHAQLLWSSCVLENSTLMDQETAQSAGWINMRIMITMSKEHSSENMLTRRSIHAREEDSLYAILCTY